MITSSLATISSNDVISLVPSRMSILMGGTGGAPSDQPEFEKLAGARTSRMGPVKLSQPRAVARTVIGLAELTLGRLSPAPLRQRFCGARDRAYPRNSGVPEGGARARARVCVLTDIDCVRDREISSYILFYSMYAVCGTYES